MNGPSYLLTIDGSAESRSAAYFAWELARQTEARVVAQHVVDTRAIWQFLSYDLPGFIGSGVYLDAKERITEVMKSVAESLMLAYTSQVSELSDNHETYIDEGSPAEEIARRAREHDLVIVGYHGRGPSGRRRRFFETLAAKCPAPMLVVRKVSKPWTKMQILVSNKMSPEKDLADIYKMGARLGLPIEVIIEEGCGKAEEERFQIGGWVNSYGIIDIRQENLQAAITKAPADAVLVVDAEALTETDELFAARVRAYLEDSPHRALMIWRDHKAEIRSEPLAS